jgi:hypothetical protein
LRDHLHNKRSVNLPVGAFVAAVPQYDGRMVRDSLNRVKDFLTNGIVFERAVSVFFHEHQVLIQKDAFFIAGIVEL